MIHNYVISLSDDKLRRKHITQEFGKRNISFQFFDAVTPKTIHSSEIQAILPHINQVLLTNNEKSCLMSHLLLWQKCIDENLPYICIFEDDVLLGEDAEKFLSNDHWLLERFSFNQPFILRFETFLSLVSVENTNVASYQNREIVNVLSTHHGMAGYLISQQAAKIWLNKLRSLTADLITPLDEILYDERESVTNFKIYQLSPAISIQIRQFNQDDSFCTSYLEQERQERYKKVNTHKPKITVLQKIKKELLRPIKQFNKYLENRKKVIIRYK